jgi:hypothetical protein
VQSRINGLDAIKLTDGAYEGIIYQYGKVGFEEDEVNDKLRIHFDYEILEYNNKVITDMKPFEKYIGDILQDLIHEGIANNNLTYTGGIDENRTGDPIEPDSQ